MKYNIKNIKKDIIEIGEKLWMRGFVAANDGNISVRVKDNLILVTPTGVSKAELNVNMILPVDIQGHVLIKSKYQPSSELKMHLEIYKKRTDIQAVVHAHPLYATAFSVVGKKIQPILSEIIISLGEIPIAPYATPSTREVPESISPFLEKHNAVLLSNHGVLTWGASLQTAYYYMETIEHTARITSIAESLGAPKVIPNDKIEYLNQLRDKYSKH